MYVVFPKLLNSDILCNISILLKLLAFKLPFLEFLGFPLKLPEDPESGIKSSMAHTFATLVGRNYHNTHILDMLL